MALAPSRNFGRLVSLVNKPVIGKLESTLVYLRCKLLVFQRAQTYNFLPFHGFYRKLIRSRKSFFNLDTMDKVRSGSVAIFDCFERQFL